MRVHHAAAAGLSFVLRSRLREQVERGTAEEKQRECASHGHSFLEWRDQAVRDGAEADDDRRRDRLSSSLSLAG
jgi:hypothetical protein